MAIVFISPKERQKTFFMGITIMFLLILLVISLVVFFAAPVKVAPVLVFNKPKVNIDMTLFALDQFKNLEPFTDIQVQYSYKGVTKTGQSKAGFISAASSDEAKATLLASGITVTYLQEAGVGRSNPFTPYYQTTAGSGGRIVIPGGG